MGGDSKELWEQSRNKFMWLVISRISNGMCVMKMLMYDGSVLYYRNGNLSGIPGSQTPAPSKCKLNCNHTFVHSIHSSILFISMYIKRTYKSKC
jgi:hypothetical protein